MSREGAGREDHRPLHLEGAHRPIFSGVDHRHLPPADRPDLRHDGSDHQQGGAGLPRPQSLRVSAAVHTGPHRSDRGPVLHPRRVRSSVRRHGDRRPEGVRGEPPAAPLAGAGLRCRRDGGDRLSHDRCPATSQLRVQVARLRHRPDDRQRRAQGARVQRHVRELRDLRRRDRGGPGGAPERLRLGRTEARRAAVHHGAGGPAAVGRGEPAGHAAAPRRCHPRDQPQRAPEVPSGGFPALRHLSRAGKPAREAERRAEGRSRDEPGRAPAGDGEGRRAQGESESVPGGDLQEVRDPVRVPGVQLPRRAARDPGPPGRANGLLRCAHSDRALLLFRADTRREHRRPRPDPPVARHVGAQHDRGRDRPVPLAGDAQGAANPAGRARPAGLLDGGRGRPEHRPRHRRGPQARAGRRGRAHRAPPPPASDCGERAARRADFPRQRVVDAVDLRVHRLRAGDRRAGVCDAGPPGHVG